MCKASLVAFNLHRFPRRVANEIISTQLPMPSTTVGFEWPRKGNLLKTRLVHWNSKSATWVNLKECLITRHLPGKWRDTDINDGQSWVSHDIGPTSPKPSSPTKRSGSRILRGYCGVREFVTLAHFTLGPKARAEEKHCWGHIMKVQIAMRHSRGWFCPRHPVMPLKERASTVQEQPK